MPSCPFVDFTEGVRYPDAAMRGNAEGQRESSGRASPASPRGNAGVMPEGGAPKLPVAPGDILAGKYRVERVLGVGGMGAVVAATHVELLETRAIKFMLPSQFGDAEAVERFLREARASSRLKSEHVAKVFDVGRLETGAPYMVMEYLEGQDLGARIQRRGPLPVPDAALYVLQACEALAEAHAAGIVHRDVKPENLFLTQGPDGGPSIKVLDFGISKMSNAADLGITSTTAIMGSPYYMSPEQTRSSRDVDHRADIWSLGVILYQLVTGRIPFDGENLAALITTVIFGQFTPASTVKPSLPAGLDRVVSRCLERDLDLRYPSVAELAEDLLPFAPPIGARSVERIVRRLRPGAGGPGLSGISEPPGPLSEPVSEAIPAPANAPSWPLSDDDTDDDPGKTSRLATSAPAEYSTLRSHADESTPRPRPAPPVASVLVKAPRSTALIVPVVAGLALALGVGGAAFFFLRSPPIASTHAAPPAVTAIASPPATATSIAERPTASPPSATAETTQPSASPPQVTVGSSASAIAGAQPPPASTAGPRHPPHDVAGKTKPAVTGVEPEKRPPPSADPFGSGRQ